MNGLSGLCYFSALIVSFALVIYGFVLLLQKEKPGENDVQVIQRQIRGFAFIMLAQVVLVLGLALCFGMSNTGVIKSFVQSAKF